MEEGEQDQEVPEAPSPLEEEENMEEEEKKEEEEGVLPPHIPAVMGSDVCVTSSPLLA